MGRAFRTSPSYAAHSFTSFRNCSAGATIPNALALGRARKRTRQINEFCNSKISRQTVGLQIHNTVRSICFADSAPAEKLHFRHEFLLFKNSRKFIAKCESTIIPAVIPKYSATQTKIFGAESFHTFIQKR